MSTRVNQITAGLNASSDVVTETASRPYERALMLRYLKIIASPRIAIRFWDGETVLANSDSPIATVHIKTRATMYRMLRQQDVGFGDEYSAGRLEIEGDLVEFLLEFYRGQTEAKTNSKFYKMLDKVLTRVPKVNNVSGSEQNIHHHYDLSNDFYKLWLDGGMQYTCAYFPQKTLSLEQAQQAKLDHVCRKLELKPGDRVVEAGCGWGGLARHMAVYYGAVVTAYNISNEQIRYATSRAKKEGYADSVKYIKDDYRNAKESCDKFVSIGMLEHVGLNHFSELGKVIDRCLTKNGRVLIHTIGRNQSRYMNAWIEKRIFPGAYPPTLKEMMDVFEPQNFSVLDVENLRLHYAKTLQQWLQRFDQNEATVQSMFDQNFVRAWRMYLAGSISAFLFSSLQLFQVVAARGQDNTVPWNREHLYSKH